MRALVTGAAGFIGSHLAERLARDGHDVVAVDCVTPYYDVSQKLANLEALAALPRIEILSADLRSDAISPLLRGVDVVFHQAGQPGVRSSWSDGFAAYVEHNVLATQRLLEAVRSRKLRRFVFASSSSVYGNARTYPTSEDDLPAPQSPYGVSKLAAEHLCGVYARAAGVPTVALRYFTVYGPRQRPDMAMHRLVEAALGGGEFPVYGDGSQIRDFTFVDDVVEANVLAATRPAPAGAVFNIAGGTAASLIDVIAIVGELTGRDVDLARRGVQAGDVERTGGSSRRAGEVLGWRPRATLRDGLARQVEWHLSRRASEALA